jgi:hypothetical protein
MPRLTYKLKLKVSQAEVWAATISNRPGDLARELAALADAGADLEFIVTRLAPEMPGRGVVFLTPLRGAKQLRAATLAGFRKVKKDRMVRVEARHTRGLAAKITDALGAANINIRGFSAARVGKRGVAFITLDRREDAEQAIRILRKL